MTQYYKIADLVVEMDSYGRTEKQAIPYLTTPNDNPNIRIISYRDVMKARIPGLSDDAAEYLGTGGCFYKELLRFDGFQLHASTVVMDGKAYLFSAKSGTGKSTHTGLWIKCFAERAYILNDDKPAIRLIDGKWYAFGTPWSGKYDMSVNERVQIAGICMLERGEKNEIVPFDGKEAIFEVFVQTNRPKAAEYRMKLLDLLDNLLTSVPVWKMKCNMELDAARVSYEAMSGNRWEDAK